MTKEKKLNGERKLRGANIYEQRIGKAEGKTHADVQDMYFVDQPHL